MAGGREKSQGRWKTEEARPSTEVRRGAQSQEKARPVVIWYAAHLVFYVKLKRKRQTRFPVWENIVLIRAETLDEAFEKAEKRAHEDGCMYPDETFTWGGVPAE